MNSKWILFAILILIVGVLIISGIVALVGGDGSAVFDSLMNQLGLSWLGS